MGNDNSETITENLLGLGDRLFSGIVLLLTAGICAHICYGYGTKKAKELFLGLILITMAGIQLYHLVNAAIYMPATRFYTYNVSGGAVLVLFLSNSEKSIVLFNSPLFFVTLRVLHITLVAETVYSRGLLSERQRWKTARNV